MSSPTSIIQIWCDNDRQFIETVRPVIAYDQQKHRGQTEYITGDVADWLVFYFNARQEKIDGPYCTLLQYALDQVDYRELAEHLIRRQEEYE